jgi:RNA polymerase sigma-70 factor (ECF subfamily)
MSEFSELLRRAREGDRGAWAALFEASRGRLERSARRELGPHLRSRYDTEDIAQSVFGDFLRGLPRFEDRGEAAFLAWLDGAVRHKVVDKARRHADAGGRAREERLDTVQALGAPAATPEPDALPSQAEEDARMTRLLGTMDPTQRAVICLFLDEGLAWEEIANRLGLPSAGAARLRYVRALAVLRDRWTRG